MRPIVSDPSRRTNLDETPWKRNGNDNSPYGAGSGWGPTGSIRSERIRLLATYLNTIAAGFAVTGVIGPMANYLYGTTAPMIRSLAQLCAEVAALLGLSLLLHVMARAVIGRLRP